MFFIVDGIYESECGFDPSDLCGYDIISPDNCPTVYTYRWTVNNTNGGKYESWEISVDVCF